MGVEIAEPVLTPLALEHNFTNEGGITAPSVCSRTSRGCGCCRNAAASGNAKDINYTWEDLLTQADQAPPFRSLVDPDATTFLSPGNMPEALRPTAGAPDRPSPQSAGESRSLLSRKPRTQVPAGARIPGRPSGHRLDTVHIVGRRLPERRMLCRFTADACDRPVVAGPAEATALR